VVAVGNAVPRYVPWTDQPGVVADEDHLEPPDRGGDDWSWRHRPDEVEASRGGDPASVHLVDVCY
jgi:hypothetical protein